MHLYAYVPEMRLVLQQLNAFIAECALLNEDREEQQTCALVNKGLRNFIDQLNLFEACLTFDTPFMDHFLACMKGQSDDDTGCEQLLEDLIIFFREKSLRLDATRITPVEQEMMRYFENNQILDDPHSLVRSWYWSYIPLLVQHDYLRAVGLNRPEGLEYLKAATGMSVFGQVFSPEGGSYR